MKRLTSKFNGERVMGETFNGYYDNAKDVNDQSREEILSKLGKLEDLEDKIGMPLENYFSQLEKEVNELKKMQDEVDYYKHGYFAMCDRNEELEKALGKACIELEKLEGYCMDNEEYIHTESCIQWDYREWKDWCIKKEFEQAQRKCWEGR